MFQDESVKPVPVIHTRYLKVHVRTSPSPRYIYISIYIYIYIYIYTQMSATSPLLILSIPEKHYQVPGIFFSVPRRLFHLNMKIHLETTRRKIRLTRYDSKPSRNGIPSLT